MKDTLHFIVTSIVDHPEAMEIDEHDSEGIDTFTIHVHKDDMGKVIGKDGKVIRSIRNALKILAMKNNRRINVAIAENS